MSEIGPIPQFLLQLRALNDKPSTLIHAQSKSSNIKLNGNNLLHPSVSTNLDGYWRPREAWIPISRNEGSSKIKIDIENSMVLTHLVKLMEETLVPTICNIQNPKNSGVMSSRCIQIREICPSIWIDKQPLWYSSGKTISPSISILSIGCVKTRIH